MVEEQHYRRLIRWYPKSWRARHGEALLGVMLDEAEAVGRSRPSTGQRWSAFVHGMGTRLGARAALWCGVAGILLSLAGLACFFIAAVMESGQDNDTIFSWLYTALSIMPGALVVPGFLGLARERGLLPAPHAFVAAVVAALTCVVATVAYFAWTVAFEAADAGAPVPLLGRLSTPLLVACGIVGAIAVAVVVDGVLSITTRMHAVPRAAIATVTGIPAGAGTILIMWIPVSIFGASAVLIILSLILRRPGRRRPSAPTVLRPSHPPLHAGVPEHPGSRAPQAENRNSGGPPTAPAQDAVGHAESTMGGRFGARIGRRTALWCGILAVVTYIGSISFVFVAALLPRWMGDSPFFIQTALSCLVGFLLSVGLISLLRERAAVAPRHAAYAVLFSVLVLISSEALAVLGVVDSINVGSGTLPQWRFHAEMALFITTWTLGATTIGVLIDGLSACRRMEPGLRAVVGLVIGALVFPPFWGLILLLGWVNLPGAIGLIIMSAVGRSAPGRRPGAPPARPRSDPRAASVLSERRIAWIRLLTVSAIVLGAGAIAWAVADRAAGAAGAHLAFTPLLAAIALWVSGRFPSSAVSTWGSAALAWASTLGFAAIAWWHPWREALRVESISVLCAGAALAWVVFTWLPRGRVLRVLAGAGTGLIYVITLVSTLASLKDFLLFAFVPVLTTPVYGLIILRRPPSPAPPAPAPVTPPPGRAPAASTHRPQP